MLEPRPTFGEGLSFLLCLRVTFQPQVKFRSVDLSHRQTLSFISNGAVVASYDLCKGGRVMLRVSSNMDPGRRREVLAASCEL